MKVLIIISVIALAFSGFSQSEEQKFKHEVGLNLAPVVIPLFTGEFEMDRIEVSYVQHRSSNFSWRMKLSMHRPTDIGITPSSRSALFRTDTISSNSSTTKLDRYYQFESSIIRAYISAEYVKKIGFAHFYTGIGIVPGIAKNESYRYKSEFETGTGLGSSTYSGGDSFRSFMLGVSPYLGIKIPISERFYLNFQTGVEFDYHFRDLHPYESSERIKTDRTELLVWPVMTELGFYVRF